MSPVCQVNRTEETENRSFLCHSESPFRSKVAVHTCLLFFPMQLYSFPRYHHQIRNPCRIDILCSGCIVAQGDMKKVWRHIRLETYFGSDRPFTKSLIQCAYPTVNIGSLQADFLPSAATDFSPNQRTIIHHRLIGRSSYDLLRYSTLGSLSQFRFTRRRESIPYYFRKCRTPRS